MGVYPIAVCKYFSSSSEDFKYVKSKIGNIMGSYKSVNSVLNAPADLSIKLSGYREADCYIELQVFGEFSGRSSFEQVTLCRVLCENIFNNRLCHAYSFLDLIEEKNWCGMKKSIEKFMIVGSSDSCKLFFCEFKRKFDFSRAKISGEVFNLFGYKKNYEIKDFDELSCQIDYDERFLSLMQHFPYRFDAIKSNLYTINNTVP